MIVPGINFLAKRQEEIRAKFKRLMLIQTFAFSILIVYVLLVGGVFVYYFFISNENKKIKNSINTQKALIQKNIEAEMKEVYLKDKLTSLLPIFKSKHKHQQLTDAIFTLLPVGISINGFTVAEDGNITFSGEAVDFSSLKSFLARVRTKNITPYMLIDFAEVNNVRLSADGTYNFAVTLKLVSKEGGLEI
jgi:Tfp pilus assembly protein PilN